MICFTLSDCVLEYLKKNPDNKEIYALLWRFVSSMGTQKLIIEPTTKSVFSHKLTPYRCF